VVDYWDNSVTKSEKVHRLHISAKLYEKHATHFLEESQVPPSFASIACTHSISSIVYPQIIVLLVCSIPLQITTSMRVCNDAMFSAK